MSEQTFWYAGFLTNLSRRVQERILPLATPFKHAAGETIFREGDPSLHLYIVKTGHVALEVHVPPKGNRTILTVGHGDVFSWSALVEPRIETASARATEDCEILGIKGGALMDLCREDTEVGFEVYRALAHIITTRLNATRLQLLDIFALP